MGAGELAALGAAAMWAIASLLWSRIPLSAIGMNLFKNLFGLSVALLQLGLLAIWFREPLFMAPGRAWIWLGLSGLVGIVLGDTVYFRSIQILGPRRALMLASTAPLFAAGFGWIVAGEQVSGRGLVGLGLAVAGVIAVIAERRDAQEGSSRTPREWRWAVLLGVLAAVCQALGGAISRSVMETCRPLEATFIRLSVAGFATLAVVGLRGDAADIGRGICQPANLKRLIPAATIGTCLGIWFSQIAFKYSSTATVTTLTATSPLFAIPLVWFFTGQKVSLRALLWTSLTVFGIYLLMSAGKAV